jgi:hypothetical protein
MVVCLKSVLTDKKWRVPAMREPAIGDIVMMSMFL